MKLSELIQKVGDENIVFQNLQHDMVGVNVGKNEATITFACEPGKAAHFARCAATGKPPQFVALVVWLPANRV